MTAEHALLILFGMVAGGCLGYVTAWRFARKLEAHEVVLAEWDQGFDIQAPLPPRRAAIHDIHERQSGR